MENFILEKTSTTPEVILNSQEGIFSFSAKSWPENAAEFYKPIIAWFNQYFNKPNKNTVVDIKLEYFNTASAKQLAKIFSILQEKSSNNNVKIRWFCEKEDIDMAATGKRYSLLLDMDFEIIIAD